MATFTVADRVGGIGGYIGGISTLLGMMPGVAGYNGIAGHNFITRDEAELQHQLSSKDSEIAMLKSEAVAEEKMIAVYKAAHEEVAALRDKVEANQKEQYGINTQQAVINAQVASNLAVDQNNIATIQTTLAGLTKTIIPITNVCPEPMMRYNSWTQPTTPETTG